MISLALYLFSLICILGYTTALFFIAQLKKDNSTIDIGYGLGFIGAASLLLIRALNSGGLSPASVLIFILIVIWGTRLARRIYNKNKGKGEDFRYRTWRETWMKKGYLYYMSRAYLQIFILQGVVISIVLLPFTLSLTSTYMDLSSLMLGLFIWIIGFCFEATGDKQLDNFIRSKNIHKGTIMKKGLWKFSRHPNYFGESTMWFGIAGIAISQGASYIALLSPFLITYLLLYVSGIPMLEKKWGGNPEWEEYKKNTSTFFPLPPKKQP